MGQASCKQCGTRSREKTGFRLNNFPDLASLPPELAVQVLSHLNATDLCLAGCVNELWCNLANVDLLWKGLCESRWCTVSAYYSDYLFHNSYKKLYMVLDNGTLTFASNPQDGIKYLVNMGVLEDAPTSIAEFIHGTEALDWCSLGLFLQDRTDVLRHLVSLHDYTNLFLPDALRQFFSLVPAPSERGRFLEVLLDMFSARYKECNAQSSITKDTIYLICYSLILLSVDLTSPHVKNKMSKREFIRNLRRATPGLSDEYLGHMYDNIYLSGHVASTA